MTREYFIREIQTWSDLLDFCYDNDCTYCEDIYSEDSRDEYINENTLIDMAGELTWREMLDWLNDIPTGYDYYRYDYNVWYAVDDEDFNIYKDDVLSWADNNQIWDDEDEYDEDEYEDIENNEKDSATPDEPMPLCELISVCSSQFQLIYDNQQRETEANISAIAEMFERNT